IGRGGEPDRDVAAVLLIEEPNQRFADQVLRRGIEQFAEGAVGFLEPTEAIDQRDADRRLGKEALEALARQSERGLPPPPGRQVTDDRAGAQLIAILDNALADPGVHGATVPALQHDFAALAALGLAVERVVGGGSLGWFFGKEIMQPGVA